MSPSNFEVLAAALALGLPVFPCLASKKPACPHGYLDAAIDPEGIRRLWDRHPGPLIGVPTGLTSGFDVIDIDPRHCGGEWLTENQHRLPKTRTHSTRSHGRHLLFACHPGLRNSAGKIAAGVDVRATGGYIAWWPACGLPVTAADALAPWPRWILDKLIVRPARPPIELPPVIHAESRYVAAAIAAGVNAVRRAAEGTRNETLNRECFALARFVTGGAITARDLAVELAGAAALAGLQEREIVSTLASAFRARGVR